MRERHAYVDRSATSRTAHARCRRHDIELFTELTGDRNPLHYDDDVAQATRFGGIVVQGGVTTGLLNAVVAEDLPGPGSVFLHTDWSFRAPVRPGDTITAEVEVVEVRTDKPIATLRTTITNQDGAPSSTARRWCGPSRSRRGPGPVGGRAGRRCDVGRAGEDPT